MTTIAISEYATPRSFASCETSSDVSSDGDVLEARCDSAEVLREKEAHLLKQFDISRGEYCPPTSSRGEYEPYFLHDWFVTEHEDTGTYEECRVALCYSKGNRAKPMSELKKSLLTSVRFCRDQETDCARGPDSERMPLQKKEARAILSKSEVHEVLYMMLSREARTISPMIRFCSDGADPLRDELWGETWSPKWWRAKRGYGVEEHPARKGVCSKEVKLRLV